MFKWSISAWEVYKLFLKIELIPKTVITSHQSEIQQIFVILGSTDRLYSRIQSSILGFEISSSIVDIV